MELAAQDKEVVLQVAGQGLKKLADGFFILITLL
jgi:exosome complex RNA-binding protein Rrp4